MKTRNDELQDLFLAARTYLLKQGRSAEVAKVVAATIMEKYASESIEDIRTTRDMFLA